jgi:hypothetical protein
MSDIKGSGLARFMEKRGFHVRERRGVLWHSVGYGMYISLPYNTTVEWTPSEAAEAVRAFGVSGIRYPSTQWPGLASGIYVCRQHDYGIATLHRNFRVHVRRGLPQVEVRPVTDEELLTQAPEMNRKAMQRQQRYDPEFCQLSRWRRFVRVVRECPCIEVIGAFVDGTLAAYNVNCIEDGCIQILYRVTDLRFEDRYATKVLDFHVTSRLVTDPAVQAVSMGWASLIPHQGHHEYKMRLGYQFEPVSSVISLHPILESTIGSTPGRSALNWLSSLFKSSQRLGMAHAVVVGAAITRKHRASQQNRGPAPESGGDKSVPVGFGR